MWTTVRVLWPAVGDHRKLHDNCLSIKSQGQSSNGDTLPSEQLVLVLLGLDFWHQELG